MIKAKNIIVSLYNNVFVFSAVFFAGLGIIIYILMGKGAVSMLSEQMLHREQVITRAGSSSIRSFIGSLGRSMVTSLINYDGNSSKLTSNFVSEWFNTPVFSALTVDKKGMVDVLYEKANLFISNETPIKVDDRDYFIWAKNAKQSEVFISSLIYPRSGTVQNSYLLTLSTPIFKDGSFDGIFVATVLLNDLTKSYLNDMKISDATEIYVIANNGNIIYSDKFEELVGKNVFAYLGDNSFLGSKYIKAEVQKALESKKEGKTRIVYPKSDKEGLSERLIAYAPIDLANDQLWYLVVSTPLEDALIFMAPFYTRQIILTSLIFVAILIYSVRFSKMVGFREGHNLYHKENPQ